MILFDYTIWDSLKVYLNKAKRKKAIESGGFVEHIEAKTGHNLYEIIDELHNMIDSEELEIGNKLLDCLEYLENLLNKTDEYIKDEIKFGENLDDLINDIDKLEQNIKNWSATPPQY